MAHERLFNRLRFIGEGSFSRVYEYGSNHVIKVPYCDGDEQMIRKFRHRKAQAEFIIHWTMFLHNRIPEVTPVWYHDGGCIVQPRKHGISIDELYGRSEHRAATAIRNLCRDARKLISDAMGPEFIIDSIEANFSFNELGDVVDWFDPIAPPAKLFF